MKLNQQLKREPRISSRDALAVDMVEPKSEFFDPRKDFPREELALLKRLVGTAHEKTTLLHDTVVSGWWLKFVDDEFAQAVKRQPGLKQDVEQECVDYMDHLELVPLKEGKWVSKLVPAIQLFPELRPMIRERFVDARLADLLIGDGFGSRLSRSFDISLKIVPLIQLYPERRVEFLELTGIDPQTVVEIVTQAMNSRGALFDHNKLLIASHMVLLFPELRSEILAALPPAKESWVASFKEYHRSFGHSDYEFGFDLTVLNVQLVQINDSGEIELEFKPRTIGKDSPKLPGRSLV